MVNCKLSDRDMYDRKHASIYSWTGLWGPDWLWFIGLICKSMRSVCFSSRSSFSELSLLCVPQKWPTIGSSALPHIEWETTDIPSSFSMERMKLTVFRICWWKPNVLGGWVLQSWQLLSTFCAHQYAHWHILRFLFQPDTFLFICDHAQWLLFSTIIEQLPSAWHHLTTFIHHFSNSIDTVVSMISVHDSFRSKYRSSILSPVVVFFKT